MAQLVRADTSTDFDKVLALIRASFAYMESRIDPPSSMHRLTAASLTAASLADHAREHALWLIQEGNDLCACAQFTPRPGCLYVGKLAVSANYRRRGYAACLIHHAEERAKALALPALAVTNSGGANGEPCHIRSTGLCKIRGNCAPRL